MRNAFSWHLVALCFLALILSAPSLGAQESQAEPPPDQSPDSTTLVFEREIFLYPRYERRNPFAPLVSGDAVGPRYEGLQLLGVLYSPQPGGSVALFGPRAEQTTQPDAMQTYRVRRGDRLGNVRILQIQETRVVVEIEEFGMTEQRIMELQRPGQGGPS